MRPVLLVTAIHVFFYDKCVTAKMC